MARLLLPISLLLANSGLLTAAQNQTAEGWEVFNNGLTTDVQWDHYSFHVNDQRVFVFSGEFHYWRIPVPGLWRDILEKIKAAGFTGFSIYTSWGYHSPNNHTVDFSTGAHNITSIFDLAKELGLYIIVRPGPYVNAEANAGGFPLWLTSGEYGTLRNNDSRYTVAWKPYFDEVSQITSRYQVTNGHNTICYQIENEYGDQWLTDPSQRVPNETAIDYMELLEASARDNGITVPLTFNDPNMNAKSWSSDWSDAGGNVDVTGVDSYPSCWSCDTSVCDSTNGAYVPYQLVEYYTYFQEFQPHMPSFLPEFQGGSYNPWAGPEGGCGDDTGADFVNLFYRWNIAQRVTAMSLYMLYGGTNWGSIATPVTATSYDYSAPISEDRSIGSKYYETKLLSLFTRSAGDLTMTDLVGNGTQYTDNSVITTYELRNPETNAAFYVTRHADSTSDTNEAFKLHLNTSAGNLIVPRNGGKIRIDGHQSKIIVTDFNLGSETLLYSTAEVLTYSVIDNEPTLVLWVPTGESGEFAVKGAKSGSVLSKCAKCSQPTFKRQGGSLTVSFTQSAGMSVLKIDDKLRVVLLDRTAAYLFWAPTLTENPLAPANETVLIQGPYLVRSVKEDGNTLEIKGDAVNATEIEVFASKKVKSLTWNGKQIKSTKSAHGSLRASLAAPKAITLPAFTSWRSNDSLPERSVSYDDTGAAWVAADHMTTYNPQPPATLPVLYGDDYGFHNGIRLFRGYFNSSASGVFLNIQGGDAFGFSAWLNGHFVGSYLGNATITQANKTITFPAEYLSSDPKTTPNVLLVVHDDTGHDETTGVLNPRGILEARLLSNTSSTAPEFTHWRLAGTAGGESNLDPVRGVYNEDGLFAERVGWHLPDFDDSKWTVASSSSSSSLSFTGATIKFFRTTVPLQIPTGLDVSISFVLGTPDDAPSNAYRAQLFVNGYQYGRYFPYIGNQVVYPVPAGVLNYNGENTIAVAVWAQTEAGAGISVDWRVNYVADSSLSVAALETAELRPGWTEVREKYA
ncbi:glycoside hydrolase family 35 protein [Aspergillus brunneoviolaceus CBS 621.78]|uniref:Beta-galactosidase B n=1 Tax=Aspergillus brunneoviolaceus CBS 621.78 TaxID=1450534 RepID=A0ACD1FYB0_9EURO|nr:putative beta-galactosidase B [Aspergillus brunneoviolaceus CBS 621.78]RAH41947.1 putative beta-galactosidase B [Aspergillus brunneoviolaceus CBS 621.78]